MEACFVEALEEVEEEELELEEEVVQVGVVGSSIGEDLGM